MLSNLFKNTLFITLLLLISCKEQQAPVAQAETTTGSTTPAIEKPYVGLKEIITGADQPDLYLPLLEGKRIALVGNQTSVVTTNEDMGVKYYTHLVDFLLSRKRNLTKVFAPEHGFRGTADAGETIADGKDKRTGIPIVSLYGKNKKPSPAMLEDIDIVIFDIQDVGARFYTYISTLHYVMEACAEQNIPILILDRPNPNGNYIAGPILEPEHKGFVGMHPIPIVHGMTIGEYAQMINGEGWLNNKIQAEITVIPAAHYTHDREYRLPIAPSPNLPNQESIYLYPSLCFFEGTDISVGRGTDMQFQVYGSPLLQETHSFTFLPQPNTGSKYPKHQNNTCYGEDLTFYTEEHGRPTGINYSFLYDAYTAYPNKEKFFNSYFVKLAGTNKIQKYIETTGDQAIDILDYEFNKELASYDAMRKQYMIYE